MDLRPWAPLVMAAVMLAVGSLAMMLLPEPAGQPLGDSMDDGIAGERAAWCVRRY